MRNRHGYRVANLNIEEELLHSLVRIIARRNEAAAGEMGAPKVEIAQTREQLKQGAGIMAKAFVRNYDKAWLAWLSPGDLQRVSAGDFRAAEQKIARVIHYLMATALVSGGIVLVETARGAKNDERLVRGAALRVLPAAFPRKENVLHKYLFGGAAALMSYGVRGALAADHASRSLREATEEMRAREGIPERCIRNGMLCVGPAYQQMRVASRLCAPLHELADRHGLYTVLQSSSPESNDARVFNRMGYEKFGEHRYGVSKRNNVGPYVINLMVRRPRQGSLASREMQEQAGCR